MVGFSKSKVNTFDLNLPKGKGKDDFDAKNSAVVRQVGIASGSKIISPENPGIESRERLSWKFRMPLEYEFMKVWSKVCHKVGAYLRLMRFESMAGLGSSHIYMGLMLALPPGGFPTLYSVVLWALWNLFLSGAGWTVNDICDKDIDKQVERTRTRPLVTGEVSVAEAMALVIVTSAAQIGVAYCMGPLAVKLALGFIPFYCIYPFTKRFFPWPQGFLGVTMAYPTLMGFAATQNVIDPIMAVPLFVSATLWNMFFDTIYGLQDIEFDKKAGLRSTSIEFEPYLKEILGVFSSLSIIGFSLTAYLSELHPISYLCIVGAGIHYIYQFRTLNVTNAKLCNKIFMENRYIGILLILGFLLGRYFQREIGN